MGKKWGYLVFAIDALKGLLGVEAGRMLGQLYLSPASGPFIGLIGGLACIIGHTFPVWLRFRGGKGVATSAGVLLGLMPIAVVSALFVWLIIFQLTRYVSVASITAAITLPGFVFIYLILNVLHDRFLLVFSFIIAAIVIWRHRSNIRRLLQGDEAAFQQDR
jgi:glycerol-3-phosphate acyltransferase PlsY